MTEQEKVVEALISQLEDEQLKRINAQNSVSKMALGQQTQQDLNNIIIQQLDLSGDLERLYHLMNGHVIKSNKDGEYWDEPDDDRLKVLSEYGAKQLMNYILMYISKNILLSNFNLEEINEKMFVLSIELIDLVYSRYEDMFYYPSPEQLYEEAEKIFRENPDKFKYFYNKDKTINQELLYNKCIKWSVQELKQRLPHFSMMLVAITDSIHATLLRALNGEERESLRKFMNIHQTISSPTVQSPKTLGGIRLN